MHPIDSKEFLEVLKSRPYILQPLTSYYFAIAYFSVNKAMTMRMCRNSSSYFSIYFFLPFYPPSTQKGSLHLHTPHRYITERLRIQPWVVLIITGSVISLIVTAGDLIFTQKGHLLTEKFKH